MVRDPKPDRTYLAYLGGVVLLVLVTLFNLFVVVPSVPLTIFDQEYSTTKRYIVEGISPYTELTANTPSIQTELTPGEVVGVYHKPFYRTVLDLPLAAVGDAKLAGAMRLTLLEIALAVILGITAKLLLRTAPGPRGLAFLLPIGLMPGLWSSLRLGDGTLIILALIVLGIWSIEQGYEELAGVLFGLGFTSIETFGLAYISILLWLIYTGRIRVLVGFGLSMTLLIIAAHIFDPNWYIGFLKSQFLFYQQSPLFSTAKTFAAGGKGAGLTISKIIAVLFLAALLYEWHTIGKRDTRSFLWVLCLSLVVPPLIGIGTAIQWSTVNILALELIVIRFGDRWKRNGIWISILIVVVLEVGVTLLLDPKSVGMALFWFPLCFVVLLYWVRWDSVRTTRLWADILEDQGKI